MRVVSMLAARKGLVALVLVIGAAIALLLAHDVPTSVTAEDERYAALILAQAGYDPARIQSDATPDFEAQVRTVVAVQDAVLTLAPHNRGIALGEEREPKDLFEEKTGLCYDRSRVIEKILTWLGLETRHVAIYSTAHDSTLQALLKPQVASHAVSEVRTAKGWMLVDSNARWIGLDASRNAVSLDDIQSTGLRSWATEARDPIDKIFTGPFIRIRGLYSRHGRFYPPFTPIPDYNLRELVSNVID
jgi:hypothetical protein